MDGWIRIDGDSWRFEDGGVRFFLLRGRERAALIDSGMGRPDAGELARRLTDLPLILVNTHADPDHISGNGAFREAYMSPAEEERFRSRGGTCAVVPVREGDRIPLGGRDLEVIDIPGHTPGSVALLDGTRRALVSGDSVQDGNIFLFGPGRDMEMYVRSLEHLAAFAGRFDEVWPMHGSFPVSPDLIPKLLEGAREVLAGRASGTPADRFGRPAVLYRFPYAGFLCDPPGE